MARAALVAAMIALAPALPEGCAKMLGKVHSSQASPSVEPAPKPVPVTSAAATATTPPVWAPPETATPPPPAPAPSAETDLSKAQALSQAGDHKKVRALLEKKVKAGKASHEEASILMESCLILRDRTCVAVIKAKHPDVEGP